MDQRSIVPHITSTAHTELDLGRSQDVFSEWPFHALEDIFEANDESDNRIFSCISRQSGEINA